MTLSARANTLGGIVRPICFAAFRLMISSNFIDWLDWNVGGFGSHQDLVDHDGDAIKALGPLGVIGYQAATMDKFCARVNRWQPIFCREFSDPSLIGVSP
jgi:hypothetical protein